MVAQAGDLFLSDVSSSGGLDGEFGDMFVGRLE